ncbi:MAG: GNAT family N-acetyltransferase, partial [Candidatus Competibacteraceae bacterium]|nr:GNAT family N-acetyltransferase [Candidatus Competibacteraceae bacterium]
AKLDVDFGDMMDFLAQDVHTRAILFHLEEIRNARKMMSAARIAARIKPVVVLKPHQLGGGSLVEDAIYDAAFQRAGVLRVNRIEQLFNAAETLATFKPVYNRRLAILGNSRSIGLLTYDLLIQAGGELAEFDQDTRRELDKLVPRGFHSDNPVDLGDRADPEHYRRALEVLLKARGIGGVLVINAPSSPQRDLDKARAVAEVAGRYRRLVLTSWMGGQAARRARELLREQHIAAYDTPGDAVQVFVQMARYRRNQELLMETPPSRPGTFSPDTQQARRIIHNALEAGRDRLNPLETSRLLTAYTIPVVDSRPARDPEQAAAIAAELDEPVVLKILSRDIRQKSQLGGVVFALKNPAEVRQAAQAMLERVARLAPQAIIDGFLVQPSLSRGPAYEITLGIRTGRQFGPVLRFGHGGTESEVINDIAYALPPLNLHLARDLISRTRLHQVMSTSPGRQVDLEALALTLIKVSQMVIDLGELTEMDIDPLWVDERGVLALDARVQIAPLEGSATRRLAIRPYPVELEEAFSLPDGREILLRPILPEDEPALQAMVRRIPQEDLRLRFFQPIRELSHDMAARLTQIDYDREMALVVAERGLPGQADIHGVVRMTADPDMERAEYAIIVERAMTGLGLGPLLMRRIIDYARQRGIQELFGEVLRENEPMLRLNRALGFTIKATPDDPGVIHVTLKL